MNNMYSALEKEIIHDLAKIEKEDEDRCSRCSGEDCMCCEIQVDRQRWVSPDELFEEVRRDEWIDNEFEHIEYEVED